MAEKRRGTGRNRGRGRERIYVICSLEEKTRWALCAGEEPVATWIRKVVNAITVVEYGQTDPEQEKWFSEHLYRNPIWDVALLPVEDKSKKLESLRFQALQEQQKNPQERVSLCEWSKLPTFACQCRNCLTVDRVESLPGWVQDRRRNSGRDG